MLLKGLFSSKNEAKQPAKLCNGSGSTSIVCDTKLPQSEQLCTANIHSTMPADTNAYTSLPYLVTPDNVFQDSDRDGEDKSQDNKDKTQSDYEKGDDEDGRQIRYERNFLLSLKFLEQCKQRPPNLMNVEHIGKVSIL